MISLKILKILATMVGILLIGVIALFLWHVPKPKTPFLGKIAKSEKIELSHANQPLFFEKKNGQWFVSEKGGPSYPTDESKMRLLLEGLESIEVADVISDRADRYSEYQVDEKTGLHIVLIGAHQEHLAEGFLGKPAPDYFHFYFRDPKHPEVYLAKGILPGEFGSSNLKEWRSRQILILKDTQQIQSITIQTPQFKTMLVKISSESWTCNGQIADLPYVTILKEQLQRLRAQDFVDLTAQPEYAREKLIVAHLEIQAGSETYQLYFGKPTKDKQSPIATNADNSVYWINDVQVSSLLKKPQDFYLKKK